MQYHTKNVIDLSSSSSDSSTSKESDSYSQSSSVKANYEKSSPKSKGGKLAENTHRRNGRTNI